MAEQPTREEFDARHCWMPYSQMGLPSEPLKVVSTDGVHINLADGRQLIDGIASWWTACHGYNHPHITQAMDSQLKIMPHVMLGGLQHDQALKLSQRLAQLVPGELNRVFLCDSGSVAVEVAMKVAVQYWLNQEVSSRTRFVCFQDSYHGDTTGAMSVCDPMDSMHSHFKGFLLEQFPHKVPACESEFQQFDQFLGDRGEQLAGVIIEPLVQMGAGMRFHSAKTLAQIFETCRRHRLLFIADEVATGFGRTGSMLAFEQAGISPDIVCVGKALTGGFVGLAATIVTRSVYSLFDTECPHHALMHGPTFMGNPLACAAANASLDLFQDDSLLARVGQIESQLRDELVACREFDHVIDVRCRGALGVVQFSHTIDLQNATKWFVEQGTWIRPIRDVVYICPPFTIGSPQLSKLCRAVSLYCAQTSQITTG